tara:strand:+ start:1029 stop:1310 length:282 start_codon:yes stop_codon:yes gene_type:complete
MIKIAQLDRNQEGGVVVVHWTASKVDGDFTASSYGVDSFTPDSSSEGFTAFEALTEEQVVGWFSLEHLETVEGALDASLEDQKAPKVISGMPW